MEKARRNFVNFNHQFRVFATWQSSLLDHASDHAMLYSPVLIRTLKLSMNRPGQNLDVILI